MTDLTTLGLRACVLRFTHEDGSPGQMCGYLEPEADGTLSFITREGLEFTQMRRALHESLWPGETETVHLTGGQTARVHTEDQCTHRPCCIHHPSAHHMRGWPMVWRSDRNLMERTCSHGIGHPDPDHMAYVLTKPGRVGEYESGVHGCDGCCLGADTPNNDHAVDQAAP